MTTARAATLLALAALLAGCNSGDDAADAVPAEEAATQKAAQPATPDKPRPARLDGVYDLREAVESTGYHCTDWSVVAETVNAVERAHCTDQVVLSIHTDATQAQASIEELADLVGPLGLDSVHLTGPNWSVNCGAHIDLCHQFQEVLFGEVQIFSGDQ